MSEPDDDVGALCGIQFGQAGEASVDFKPKPAQGLDHDDTTRARGQAGVAEIDREVGQMNVAFGASADHRSVRLQRAGSGDFSTGGASGDLMDAKFHRAATSRKRH